LFVVRKWSDCAILVTAILFYTANIFFCTIIKRFFCKEPRICRAGIAPKRRV
jgi:hypothetical protein